jgi:hypothetical protein
VEKKRIKKIGLNLLKLVISAGAIAWVLSKISFREVMHIFGQSAPGYLMLALLFFVLSKVLAASRLNLLFRESGAHLSWWLNLKLYWMGMFYNLFLPGGIGGDGYKIYLVNKFRQNGLKKNFSAVVIDRVSGLVAIGLITITLYFFSAIQIPYGQWAWVGYFLVYSGFLLLLRLFFPLFLKIHLPLTGWSLALQLSQLFSALFILLAFHQQAHLVDYLFLFFLSSVAAALPITIGGAGARELVFLYGSQQLGLAGDLSIALSFMFYLITAFASLWGIVWVFRPPFREEGENDLTTGPAS